MVGFTEAVRLFFKRYADFGGRSTRAEYWWWALFFWGLLIIVMSAVTIVDPYWLQSEEINGRATLILFPYGLFILGIIIPSLALSVRRFHDVGISGWIYLLLVVPSAIPILGFIFSLAIFVISVLPSKPALLKWGPPRDGRVLPTFAGTQSPSTPQTGDNRQQPPGYWTRRD